MLPTTKLTILVVCLLAFSGPLGTFGQVSQDPTAVCQANYAKFNRNHTACLSPNGCKITHWGITKAEMKKIVDTHNNFRNLIASGNETRLGFPSAANMLKMEWDNELAYVAQAHANQCKFEHDCYDCRRTDRYEFVGQNLYIYQTTRTEAEIQWPNIIKEWYDEINIAPPVVAQSFDLFNLNIGHFTQIAWATTNRIGCGYVTYDITGQEGIFKTAQLYTCNYAPGGNFLGEKMYEDGNSATRCPARHHRSKRFTSLCEFARKTNKNVPRKKTTKKTTKKVTTITTTRTQLNPKFESLPHSTPLITFPALLLPRTTLATSPLTRPSSASPQSTLPQSTRPIAPLTTTTSRRVVTTTSNVKPSTPKATPKPTTTTTTITTIATTPTATFSLKPFQTKPIPSTTNSVTRVNKRVTHWWDKWNWTNSLANKDKPERTTRAPTWRQWSGPWSTTGTSTKPRWTTLNQPGQPITTQIVRFFMSHNGTTAVNHFI